MKIATHSLTFLSAVAITAFAGCATTHQEIGSADHPSAKAQTKTEHQHGDAPADMPLPPGWTKADMDACMAAGTPGKQQAMLARAAGHWAGTSTMWMAPDTQPTTSQTTANISTIMDGRYTKCEFSGDMGMGPFQGLGFNGFDNVSQKYVSTWIDTMSTGIMVGDGVMSADGNTFTWTYHFNCPIQKKPTTMREVQHFASDNAMTLDMYGDEPHTGKEYKMMHIEMTRQSP
jgi:hypothetical protein